MTIWENKKILVTGGAGFIGSHLCDELIKYNPKQLIIYDNLIASKYDNIRHLFEHNNNVLFVDGDVRNEYMLTSYVAGCDYIFHLAATNVGYSVLYPQKDLDTNITGTFNLMKLISDNHRVRVIHVSSGSVENPSTPYAISKAAGENYALYFARENKIKLSVVRPYHVFGPRQDMNGKCGVINIFLSRILQEKSPIIWGEGDAIKCFTYVKDLVDAMIMVATEDKTIGKIYDVASNTRISIKDLAILLIEKYAADKNMQLIFGQPKVGENLALHPDTKRIKLFGWKPRYSFEEGLDETVQWVKEQIYGG